MMRKAIAEFVAKEVKPGASERDEKEEFSMELFQKMGAMGLAGIPMPEEYGGAGATTWDTPSPWKRSPRWMLQRGLPFLAHTSLCSVPILEYGTEEQKQKFLVPLAQGKKLGAFGLTEPFAGSDAAGMKSVAVLDKDHYVLNGSKQFITNAGYADIYVIIAFTDKSQKSRGFSAFIVEKDTPGFTFGKKEKKLGIRSSATGELIFEDCRIPKENLLGKEGEGFKIAMSTLDGGRTGVAAQALGIAQGAFDEAVEYAKVREQFGQPIANFQGISFKLADMAVQIEAARLLTYQAAFLKGKKLPYAKQSLWPNYLPLISPWT
jgi:butyryl-CoA dehydrogenase